MIRISFLSILLALASCQSETQNNSFTVTNTLGHARSTEVVKVPGELLKLEEGQSVEDFGIEDESGNLQVVQYIDQNQDGLADEIIFQPTVPATGTARYSVKKLIEGEPNPESQKSCFSRFVPERTDDYAWENDKVAFRTFGPTAQQMKEEGVPGGTLTSGIDCWLKKVEYPIINRWYKKYETNSNAYHEDTGEGLDNFHVGISRGCGGIAVKGGEEFYTSKNFTHYKTLTNGSLRTAFELDYAPWSIGGSDTVHSTNQVSLDLGNQLSRFEVSARGTDTLYAGLTLHENDGKVTVDSLDGWVSYYQPHGDSYLATAIVAAPGYYIGSELVETEVKDLSHVYARLSVQDEKSIYYTGFYWQKSGQFKGPKEWEAYLTRFAAQLTNPLTVAIE